jgi:hypothetical protein
MPNNKAEAGARRALRKGRFWTFGDCREGRNYLHKSAFCHINRGAQSVFRLDFTPILANDLIIDGGGVLSEFL